MGVVWGFPVFLPVSLQAGGNIEVLSECINLAVSLFLLLSTRDSLDVLIQSVQRAA